MFPVGRAADVEILLNIKQIFHVVYLYLGKH